MAIRWNQFPHARIGLDIYARLARNDVSRSSDDSLRHILLRRLPSLDAEDHRRYIEQEARHLVEHLRITRDVYREYVKSQGCRPVLEAQWVVLRFAVLPTAISILRQAVKDYARLTRVAGRDLSLLFGILTRTCFDKATDGLRLLHGPDLEDDTAATHDELESLSKLVDEHSLLIFGDIRDRGGAVWRPLGGGPFSADDPRSIRRSFQLSVLSEGITLPVWVGIRKEIWARTVHWTVGLCDLFTSVQEELMSQWRSLPSDSQVHNLRLRDQNSGFRPIVVSTRRPGRKPRLPQEFVDYAGALWRRAFAGANNYVPDDQLRKIAVALDERGCVPPDEYLEGKVAQEVRAFNSRNSNSKTGPIKSWFQLVSHGDKDHMRGMRRLLSRCAERLSDDSLSGN